MHRVAVTGLGIISPLGAGREENWKAMLDGRSGVVLVRHLEEAKTPKPLPVRIGGEVKGFDLRSLDLKKLKTNLLDRISRLALAAAGPALSDARLSENERKGAWVILGTGIGGFATSEEQTRRLWSKGSAMPSTIPRLMHNAPAAAVSIEYGLKGPSWTAGAACASGVFAMVTAFEMVASGRTQTVVTGGAEAPLTPLTMAAFGGRLGALATGREDDPEKASRPFDRRRNGFVVGEGAAVLVFEEMEHARAREAGVLAEVLGYGATSDSYNLVAPAPDGAMAGEAMRGALQAAGRSPDERPERIYVNAHGTSTHEGDLSEINAIKKCFGDAAPEVRVSSTKSVTGHLIGAAGAVEAAACILALREKRIPPTINLDDLDPDCAGVHHVANRAEDCEVELALDNSFGFGGHNGCLAFGPPPPA